MTGTWLDAPFNGGMRDLGRALNKMPGVYCDENWWGDYKKLIPVITAHPHCKHAVIGYSGGGMTATFLSRAIPGVTIDLMIAYDPSPAGRLMPLWTNVERAICYHNKNPGMWFPGVGKIGGGMLRALRHNTPVIEVHEISEFHMAVDSDQNLHAITIDAIKKLRS
jgi:hypothetical protein